MKDYSCRLGFVAVLVCVGHFSLRLHAQPTVTADGSLGVSSFCGVWEIKSASSYETRRLEIQPNGSVTETTTYKSPTSETSEVQRKVWRRVGEQVRITRTGDEVPSGQTMTIDLPNDPNQTIITETWVYETSTRTNRLVARRVEASSEGVAKSVAPNSELSKLKVAVMPKIDKAAEGYYKIERISLAISLLNPSVRAATGPLTIKYWVIGRNIMDPKQYFLLTDGRSTCALGCTSQDREFKFNSDPFMNRYYADSSGYKYEGWIIVIKDAGNRIVLIKSNKPDWERLVDKVEMLDNSASFDARLNKLKGGFMRY